MNADMDLLWSQLQLDLIKNILQYDCPVKLRNGKWMNQIDNRDPRYDLLSKIPKKTIHKYNVDGMEYQYTYVFLSDKYNMYFQDDLDMLNTSEENQPILFYCNLQTQTYWRYILA